MNISRYQAGLKESPTGKGGPEVHDRVHFDPAICGGRPHIRGTRVRVSDILDLLANGVKSSDILADYPYLSEADLRAARGHMNANPAK